MKHSDAHPSQHKLHSEPDSHGVMLGSIDTSAVILNYTSSSLQLISTVANESTVKWHAHAAWLSATEESLCTETVGQYKTCSQFGHKTSSLLEGISIQCEQEPIQCPSIPIIEDGCWVSKGMLCQH